MSIYIYIYIHIYTRIYTYIYIKLSLKWKKFHEQKVFIFLFHIFCENFSKIGPIIKKIPKFANDPLKPLNYLIEIYEMKYKFQNTSLHIAVKKCKYISIPPSIFNLFHYN